MLTIRFNVVVSPYVFDVEIYRSQVYVSLRFPLPRIWNEQKNFLPSNREKKYKKTKWNDFVSFSILWHGDGMKIFLKRINISCRWNFRLKTLKKREKKTTHRSIKNFKYRFYAAAFYLQKRKTFELEYFCAVFASLGDFTLKRVFLYLVSKRNEFIYHNILTSHLFLSIHISVLLNLLTPFNKLEIKDHLFLLWNENIALHINEAYSISLNQI